MEYYPRRFSMPKYRNGTKVCFIGNDMSFHSGTIVQIEHVEIPNNETRGITRYAIEEDENKKRHRVCENFVCLPEQFADFKKAVEAKLANRNTPLDLINEWKTIFLHDFDDSENQTFEL